ncbi:MAG: hypothetical protein EA424_21440 [Planctomycetaceae bacterium]|nr:MAG: hypothetical protein EA424_21440 [Planctomycetaceae bacterium]
MARIEPAISHIPGFPRFFLCRDAPRPDLAAAGDLPAGFAGATWMVGTTWIEGDSIEGESGGADGRSATVFTAAQ